MGRKTSVAISIDIDLLKQIDKHVDEARLRTRSAFFDLASKQFLESFDETRLEGLRNRKKRIDAELKVLEEKKREQQKAEQQRQDKAFLEGVQRLKVFGYTKGYAKQEGIDIGNIIWRVDEISRDLNLSEETKRKLLQYLGWKPKGGWNC